MTEDERQNLLGTVVEANVGLSEVAFKLRRELTPKAPALKTAIKAERETFRLKQELQRLDIEDLDPAKRSESLPEVRRSGKVVDIEQLRRQKQGRGHLTKREKSDAKEIRRLVRLKYTLT